MIKLLLLPLLVLPLAAADAKTEIDKLKETIDRAHANKEAATYSKHHTADYFSVSRTAVIRDLKASIEYFSTPRPSDLKSEVLKTNVYGDTVIELSKESWTSANGAKLQAYITHTYVKQGGVWKVAARNSTTIAAATAK